MSDMQVRYRPAVQDDTDGAPPPWTYVSGGSAGEPIPLPGQVGDVFNVAWRTVLAGGQVSEWVRLEDQAISGEGAVLFAVPQNAWVDCTNILRWEYEEAPPALAGWIVRTAEGNYPHFGFAREAHEGVLRSPALPLHGIPKGPRTFFIAPVDFLGNVGEPFRLVVESGPYEEQEAVVETSETHGPGVWPGQIEAGAEDAPLGGLAGVPLVGLYAGDSRPMYSGDATADFYGGDRGDVIYRVDLVPETDDDLSVSQISIGPDTTPAAGWWTELKVGNRPFYSGSPFAKVYDGGSTRKLYSEPFDGEWVYKGGDGTQALYRGGEGTRFYRSPLWRPWPGKVTALSRMPYAIRITVPGNRGEQAVLRSIRFRVTRPTVAIDQATLDAGLALKIDLSQKGAAFGVASLDAGAKIPWELMPVRTEAGSVVLLGSGPTSVAFTVGRFISTPSVVASIDGALVDFAESVQITNRSSSGFDVEVFDALGVSLATTVNWIAMVT